MKSHKITRVEDIPNRITERHRDLTDVYAVLKAYQCAVGFSCTQVVKVGRGYYGYVLLNDTEIK